MVKSHQYIKSKHINMKCCSKLYTASENDCVNNQSSVFQEGCIIVLSGDIVTCVGPGEIGENQLN
jgi:hypothetical protein